MSLDVLPTTLRVASVPAAHPYVAHLRLDAAGIVLLPDPMPPGAPPGRWWPPMMLDAAWIARHAESFDVLHIHFGTESLSMAALSSALAALADAGRPLVYTVHDLENPQVADQSHHLEQLDLLISEAAELITLTRGAANEIARRWGVPSTVIAHPRMLAEGQAVSPLAGGGPLSAPPSSGLTVGVHLRDLRPSIDGPGVTHGLVGALAELRADGLDARARIVVFEQVRDSGQLDHVRAAAGTDGHVSVIQQARASDAALVADLSSLDVSVLPYRHGTHSGWAELCWDLAVPLAGADIGYIAEQHSEPGWFSVCDPTDPASLARVLRPLALESADSAASGARPARDPVITARRAERQRREFQLAAAHHAVYVRALNLT